MTKSKDGPFDVRQYPNQGDKETQQSTTPERYDDIPLERIRPNPFQPRKTFKKEVLEGLAQSGNGFFRETEKELFLEKGDPVSENIQKGVKESVSAFMSRFAGRCVLKEAQ